MKFDDSYCVSYRVSRSRNRVNCVLQLRRGSLLSLDTRPSESFPSLPQLMSSGKTFRSLQLIGGPSCAPGKSEAIACYRTIHWRGRNHMRCWKLSERQQREMSSSFRKSAVVEPWRKTTNPLIPSANKMNRIKHTRYVSIFLLLRVAARPLSPLASILSAFCDAQSAALRASQDFFLPFFLFRIEASYTRLHRRSLASFSFFFIAHIVALEETRITGRRSALQVSANRGGVRETESRGTSTRNRIQMHNIL